MFKHLFSRPKPEQPDQLRLLQERTRQRQREAFLRLKEEGKLSLYGYKPPKDTDLQRTFNAARSQLTRSQS